MAGKKALTKSQIVGGLADKTGLSKKDVANLLAELTALAYKEAKAGFTIPGLGKLVVVNRKARMGRNPQTGEPVKIKASKKLAFRQSAVMKAQVMGGR